jgi:hypothetical protein
MFTMMEIFTEARTTLSEMYFADSQTHLSVVRYGIRVSMCRKTGKVTLSSTCLHDEYCELKLPVANIILYLGWRDGVIEAACQMLEQRLDMLNMQLKIQLARGIKGKKSSEALSEEIVETNKKLIKWKKYSKR